MPTPDDATLEADVLAAARGERDAFARVITATSALVVGVALAETRDADVARDAAQDVYLQVWQGLGQLRQPASFLPWLRESARRQARRLAARRRRQAPGEVGLEEIESPSDGPAQRLLDEERAALVREAIEALPDDSRETLLLYYLEGHSAAQVGRLLGLSDAAVHQRLSRARGMVREEVLQRLGDAIGRAAPGGAFTAAVVALLAPRTAVALGIGELMAMASGTKVTAGVIAAAFLALAFLLYPRGGPPGPGTPTVITVARPAEELAPGAAPRPTPALAAAAVEEGRLEVRVTGDGALLPGAEVRAYLRLPLDPAEGRSAWRLAGQTVSGADGVARLPAAAGSWLVAASAPGFSRVQVAVIRPVGEVATSVEASLARPLALQGRTVDRAGQPVALAMLRLARQPDGARVDVPLPEEEQLGAVADGAGSFTLDGLAQGSWRLTAEAPGHARTVVDEVRLPRSGPLTVTLDASGVIEGLVRLADGSPAAGSEVAFAGGPELLRTPAGPRGGFAAEVQAGSYRVSARLGDQVGWLNRPLPVAAGQVARGVVITLGAPARFAGRVEAMDGRAVAGAVLSIGPADASGELARAVTGPDGRFESAPMPPGEYDLGAEAAGFTPAERRGLVLLAGQRFELTVKLSGTGAVRGRITDGAGAPLAGIRVHGGKRWSGGFGQGEAETVTGSDGGYRFDGLEVGPAVVRARRPGADSGAAKALDVKEGEVATADLTLLDLGTVEGTIVAPDGQPVTGKAYAVLGPDDPNWDEGTQTRVEADPSGRFHLAVPTGRWHAFATRSRRTNGVYKPTAVVIEAGQVSRVELVLADGAEGGRILLRFLEPGGAPSSGARAEIALSPEARLLTSADERGELPVSAGAPAEGEAPPILVSARNGGRQAVDVPVARTATDATIQLQPGARLSGRVDGGSQPVTDFTLTVEMPRRPFFSYSEAVSRQFAGDRFGLSDVPTGQATLLAVADDGRAGRTSLELRSGEASEAVIRLEAPGRIRARPVTTPGHPAPGAYLTLGSRMIDADPAGFYHRPGDGEGGLLEADGVAPGTVEIEVGARCFEPVRREVNVRPGETLDLGEVVLKAVPKSACGG